MGLANVLVNHLEHTWRNLTAIQVLVTVVILFAAQLLYKLIRAQLQRANVYSQFPTPEGGHWLLGHLQLLGGKNSALALSLDYATKHVHCYAFNIGPFRTVVRLVHPDTIKVLLNTKEPKDDFGYKFAMPWIGNGLFMLNGQKWFRNRKLLTPGFHFDVLKAYVGIFATSTSELLGQWRTTTGPVEISQPISLLTLDVILKCAFSYESGCQTEGDDNAYAAAVHSLLKMVFDRTRFPPYYNDFIFAISPLGRRFKKACQLVHGFSEQVIQQRKAALQNRTRETNRKYMDFLDILLQARDEDGFGLTDEEIRAEVDTFMFAGHDTTATGMSWALYNLARHPECQARCQQEVDSLLQEKGEITWADLPLLAYVTMCIKESLRLYPPVPTIARTLSKPLTLPDGRTIPAGCLASISSYSLHHNPHVWEDPEEFRPERFTSENSKGRHPHAFIPFSAGPRNCIGQVFAMTEMKVMIALLLRHFTFELDETHPPPLPVPRGVLKPQNGIYLKITPRDV